MELKEKIENNNDKQSQAAQANGLVLQAEKKLKAWTLLSDQKYDDACELYEKAAAHYRVATQWNKSAQCYVKAAEISEKQKNVNGAIEYYIHAATIFKDTDPQEAIKMYSLAIGLLRDNNKFSRAAKLWKEIAEIEQKEGHITETIKAWSECADCFELGNQTVSANMAYIRIAELVAKEEEDYPRAINLYEKVSNSINDGLGKYAINGYVFRANLLRLIIGSRKNDIKSVRSANDHYKQSYPTLWNGSRECTLIEGILRAFDDQDVDLFVNTLYTYDAVSKLDNWITKLLLAIKVELQNMINNPTDVDLADKML